jgi:type I restriction enzyme S subunit
VLRPGISVDVDFFSYLFKSHDYIRALQATSNFIRDGQDLNFHNFCLVDLPLIPMQEQRAIAAYLVATTADIDTAMVRAEREIKLMNEYRTHLISDVVIGKVDVRGISVEEMPAIDEFDEDIAPESEDEYSDSNLEEETADADG